MSDDVFIIDRHGRRCRARKGDVLADGDRLVFPVTLMDAALHDALLEKYRKDDVVRVVDAAGLPAGHRPGYLFSCDNALGDRAVEAAYSERLARLDATTRRRRRPDDDDGGADGRRKESESERRQRLARKAAAATMGTDARQMTLDELRERADAAYADRVARMCAAWRTR